jgi:hypothetical protein
MPTGGIVSLCELPDAVRLVTESTKQRSRSAFEKPLLSRKVCFPRHLNPRRFYCSS